MVMVYTCDMCIFECVYRPVVRFLQPVKYRKPLSDFKFQQIILAEESFLKQSFVKYYERL